MLKATKFNINQHWLAEAILSKPNTFVGPAGIDRLILLSVCVYNPDWLGCIEYFCSPVTTYIAIFASSSPCFFFSAGLCWSGFGLVQTRLRPLLAMVRARVWLQLLLPMHVPDLVGAHLYTRSFSTLLFIYLGVCWI